MNSFEAAIRDYREGLGRFHERMPEVVDAYHTFTGACFAPGALDQKTKHLMGLAISLCTQDEYCMIYHTDQAVQHGATRQEIEEVVAVAAALGGGVALSQGVTLVQDLLNHLQGARGKAVQ